MDYSYTFSSAAKLTSILLFISLATTHGWDLHLLDIKNAFLHEDLAEVYMKQPLGFFAQREIGRVCCLRKSLYGLKQSPHVWFDKNSIKLLRNFACRRVNLTTSSSIGTAV